MPSRMILFLVDKKAVNSMYADIHKDASCLPSFLSILLSFSSFSFFHFLYFSLSPSFSPSGLSICTRASN
ncbi:hypothetical protein CSUI_010524 [Cystoisospora suis]|uniref:Uncharacterized protein n=1 Tax=Cystoisospora suis TaxID=483139 RepID=A0A2C6KH51_9APIC|nr:hypothetical protein CSUI_010524 [Cystoisospora suis]